jgi:hypothetical protein
LAIATSLISYWSLDEASGNALDAHGSNVLTDFTGAIGTAAGKVSGARDFEASSSQFFYCFSNASLICGDIDYTITCWVNLESKGSPTTRLLVCKYSAANFEYAVIYDSGTDRFAFYAGSGSTKVDANTLGSPSIATWYFIVSRYVASTNTISIQVNDGAVDSQGSITAVTGASNFMIGYRDDGGTSYMDGLIDEVGFWKRELTSGESTELYNAGSGRSYAYITAVTPDPLSPGVCVGFA